MLQPSSVESLDVSRADYEYAAAEVAGSLNENRFTVLQLDEQSVFQMETAQAALKDFHREFTASVASDLGAQHSSSDFKYLPGREAAEPGSPMSLLSQVCMIKVFAWLVKPSEAELYLSAGLPFFEQNSSQRPQKFSSTTGIGCGCSSLECPA